MEEDVEEGDDYIEISFEAPPANPVQMPARSAGAIPIRAPNILRDPVAEKKRRLNIKGDQRIIRELNDIRVEDKLDDSIQALIDCRFESPSNSSETVLLCRELRTVTAVCNRLLLELEQPGAVLTKHQQIALKVGRQRLMELLYRPNTFIDDPHTFTEKWVDKTLRIDIYIFHAIMLCSDYCGRVKEVHARLEKLTPRSPEFAEALKQKLFFPSLQDREFLKLSPQELIVTVNFLESRWNYLDPVKDDLRAALDIILDRVSSIAVSIQDTKIFGSVTKYRKPLTDTSSQITTVYLEDFCWSLMQMYKKLSLCEKIMRWNTPFPFEITHEEADGLEKDLTATALKMKNTALQAKYFAAYMNAFLRPSEVKRYQRDHPGLELSGSMIIEKMRGSLSKNALMEKLAGAPWEITRDKLLSAYELDVMYLMMLDTRVNNACNKFNWMVTMVYYNIHLVEMHNPIQTLTKGKPFPMLVQAFNGTGVLYAGKYYNHNSAAKSFIHWLCIILSPPFKGKWGKHNFGGLHVLLPASVKAKAGLQFMSGTT